MRPYLPRGWSLAGSLALHAAFGLGALLPAASSARTRVVAPTPAADPWVGEAFEVEALGDPGTPAVPDRGEGASERAGPESTALVPPAQRSPSEPRRSRAEPPSPQDQAAPPERAERPQSPESPSGAPPKLSQARSEPPAEGAPGSNGEEGRGAASFGAAGGEARERSLPKAFVRALPAAASDRDRTWGRLPPGPAGKAKVGLTLDAEGRVTEVAFEKESEVPRHLVGLVRRSVRLLGAGRFALSPASSERGREVFALSASVSDGPPLGDEFADPLHILQREFEPPSGDRPGRAVFVYASGRRVEIRVELVSAESP